MGKKNEQDLAPDCPCVSPFPAWVKTIGVLAPAGPPDSVTLQCGCDRLRAWGLDVVTAGHVSARDRFLAGSDTQRLAGLEELLRDPNVDLAIAARGGYGCARLLDRIDWAWVAERRLPVMGYSDITALHLAGWNHARLRGLAGPMITAGFSRPLASEQQRTDFREAMASLAAAFNPVTSVPMRAGHRLEVIRPGTAHGILVPATLSVLVSLLGTAHMPALAHSILILEDVNEPAYKIDRYLTHLRQAGVLCELAGMVFGAFAGCVDAQWLPSVLEDHAQYVAGPVIGGLPFGHCHPSLTLPVGRMGQLLADRVPPQLGWTGWDLAE